MAYVFFHSLECVILKSTGSVGCHISGFVLFFLFGFMRIPFVFLFGRFYIIDQIISPRPWHFVCLILSCINKISLL